MFSSLRVKLQSFLNPRRSASICVESKAKKVEPKRDKSLKKINDDYGNICETPKKYPSFEIPRGRFDCVQTVAKEPSFQVHCPTEFVTNRSKNLLDFVSEIQSGEDSSKLLPDSQEMKTVSRKKPTPHLSQNQCEMVELEVEVENQTGLEQLQHSISDQIRSNEVEYPTSDTARESTLINFLNENSNSKPESVKKSQVSIKMSKVESIKKERLQQFEEGKKKQLKQNIKNKCMICQEKTNYADSFHLACTHRIHRICADIIRWKPKMKCHLCERKSLKEVVFHLKREDAHKKGRGIPSGGSNIQRDSFNNQRQSWRSSRAQDRSFDRRSMSSQGRWAS